ncbi:BT4734/BF3469 family protein [Chryseobacterium contaminans]|uniref:BT4734/BF3469 family protein n=1 Tax=Chryseobacterium contaminans TaxID=1423959 RepID=UPI00301A88AE
MINKIDYCTNRTITGSFQDIKEVIKFIRNPPPEHIELVQYARSLERGSDEYKAIKIYKLPAVTINFQYSNNYITGKNLDKPTGYLYIDVDNLTEQDLKINTAYVCAYWRSLSDKGLTLVVKVDGLTPENFKIATQEIANALDIPYDPQAVSIDRLTVLSYDSNAYYNDNVEIFPIPELLANLDSDVTVEHSGNRTQFFRDTIIKDNSLIGIHCNGKIRYHNLDEVTKDMVFEYNDQGIHDCGQNKIKYHNTFMSKGVKEGKREKTLSLYAKRLIYLNPDLNIEILSKLIYTANMLNLLVPLESKEVQNIIDKAFKDRKIPRSNKTKRFFFQDITLTPVEKSKKCLEVLNQERREKTQEKKNKISELLCNWDCHTDGKITPKKVMELTGLKKTMVYDYFKENKGIIPYCDNQ